jgi:cytochrome c peroxidase
VLSSRYGIALPLLIGSTLAAVPLHAGANDLYVPNGFLGFQFVPPYSTRNPFPKAELEKIAHGFQLFTTEKFDGNGRVCSTCHIPEKNYNVTVKDVLSMSGEDRRLVFGGDNLKLENHDAVETLGLFNINQGFGPGTEGAPPPATPGAPVSPEGPFRASMSIGGVGFTTLNNYVCRPGTPSPGGTDCSNAAGPLPLSNAAVDDGTREIMLGWAGDGPLAEMFPNAGGGASQECEAAIEDFMKDLGTFSNLEKALGTFAIAAVKTHFTRTQDRVPGKDFRCPTSQELADMAKFQKWLGRRFELDITKLKFTAPATEEGRILFSRRETSCVGCHVNAGASDTQGRVKNYPVPFLKSDGSPDPDYNGGTPASPRNEPFDIIGANKASRNGAAFFEWELDQRITAKISNGQPNSTFNPFQPFDKGDLQLRSAGEAGFNVQSLIEATRKNQFFHNNGVSQAVNGVETSIEDAIEHYFTDKFDASQGGTAVRGAFRGGILGPSVLANLGGQDAIDKMGVFLRALSSVYAIADCERFLDEAIYRIDQGMDADLPVRHCRFALNDAKQVLAGVQLRPNPYEEVPKELVKLEKQLDAALAGGFAGRNQDSMKKKLSATRVRFAETRRSLATTPELP